MRAASAPAGRWTWRLPFTPTSMRIKGARPQFHDPLPAGAEKGVVWVAPRLVCEIAYRDWTADGLDPPGRVQGFARR